LIRCTATLRERHKSDSQQFHGSHTRRGRVILFLYLNSIYISIKCPCRAGGGLFKLMQSSCHTEASENYTQLPLSTARSECKKALRGELCACIHKCLQSRTIHYATADFNRCSHYSVSALFNLCLIGVMPLGKYELSHLISSQRVAP
jgi:hypothetical protein